MYNNYSSLTVQICELLDLEQDSDQFDEVFKHCIEHICLRTKIKDFHSKINSCVDFSELELTPSKFRLAIAKSGYILLNFKFYLSFLSLKRGTITEDDYYYYALQFDIDGHDHKVIVDLLGSRVGRRTLRSIVKNGLSKFSQADFHPDRMEEIVSDFTEMLPELKMHCRRTINKFFKFIMSTFNILPSEIMSELLVSAVKAHYYSHPNNNSIERQLGKLRASIHNHAINEIKAYTTSKRERLVCEGEDSKGVKKFTLRTVSENQMSLTSLENPDVDVPYDSMFCKRTQEEIIGEEELKFSLAQISKKYGFSSSQNRLARAFLSKDCTMFNRWLRKHKYMRSASRTTSEFLSTKTTDEQLTVLGEYLRVSPRYLQTKALPSMARAFGVKL